MDKPALLQHLALIRERAEAAHLEVVLARSVISELERSGRDMTAAKFQLNKWKMREQKLLREMDWILDQLDQEER